MKDIEKIEKYLMDRLDKLNNDKHMKKHGDQEIKRSYAVTATSLAFMKVKDFEIKVKCLPIETQEKISK